MSLDCNIYSTNLKENGEKQIDIYLNRLGWIVLEYLHDKKYVSEEEIKECYYTIQLGRTVILKIINNLVNYFNHQDEKVFSSSCYRDYPTSEASNLGYVLGLLYELLIYMSSNIDDKIYLYASW